MSLRRGFWLARDPLLLELSRSPSPASLSLLSPSHSPPLMSYCWALMECVLSACVYYLCKISAQNKYTHPHLGVGVCVCLFFTPHYVWDNFLEPNREHINCGSKWGCHFRHPLFVNFVYVCSLTRMTCALSQFAHVHVEGTDLKMLKWRMKNVRP